MPYPTCTFIMTKGTLCGSPAMTNHTLCYYHSRETQRKENFQQARELKNSDHFYKYPMQQEALNPDIIESLEIPSLDDAESVQVALTNVIRAVVSGHISDKKAGLALFGLQIAAGNVKNVRLKVYDTDKFASDDPQPIAPLVTVPLPPAGHNDELIAQAAAARAAAKQNAVKQTDEKKPAASVPAPPESVISVGAPPLSEGQGGNETGRETASPQENAAQPSDSVQRETVQPETSRKLPISPQARERLARAVTRLANKPNSKTFAQHIKLAAALHDGKLKATEFLKEQKTNGSGG